jgi:Tn3 transposase DDE domain
VEQYNALEDWVRFAGGGKMYAQAFEEQEKLVKYTGLLTNCIILDILALPQVVPLSSSSIL